MINKSICLLCCLFILLTCLAACGKNNTKDLPAADESAEVMIETEEAVENNSEPAVTAIEIGKEYEIRGVGSFTALRITASEKLEAEKNETSAYTTGDPYDTYVNMVFTFTNTSDSTVNSNEIMTINAIGGLLNKYDRTTFCVESEDLMSLEKNVDIKPSETVRLHAAISVLKAENWVTVTYDINGEQLEYTLKTEELL